VASADAQGGLVAISIVPAQWLVAVLAGGERFG
jgi:hypothetical protein